MNLYEELALFQTNPTPLPDNRYHKTGKGDYQNGDLFLGVTALGIRTVALHHFATITEAELECLLASPVHDHRAIAVAILAMRSRRGPEAVRQEIMEWYLQHLDRVNGWDLVDGSCIDIVGRRLVESNDFSLLHELVASEHLWTKRVGIVSTFALIRAGFLDETLAVLKQALSDERDLIHKATGWMLREVGKRDRGKLDCFLREYYDKLPRTTLRYAIERHEEATRKEILKGIFKEE